MSMTWNRSPFPFVTHKLTLEPGEEWCRDCVGTGRRALSQKITGPGMCDLVLRTKTCDTCHGTGKVRIPPPQSKGYAMLLRILDVGFRSGTIPLIAGIGLGAIAALFYINWRD